MKGESLQTILGIRKCKDLTFMPYLTIGSRFFNVVKIHASDGHTDRLMDRRMGKILIAIDHVRSAIVVVW